MKKLKVPRIAEAGALVTVAAHKISTANWPAFPVGPATLFKIARMGEQLCLLFEVNEENPRTANFADGQPVYQDSCVEFFCKAPGSDRYFNFEFNSAGACLASSRRARKEDVRPLTADEYASIRRVSTRADRSWLLMVTIPLNLIFGEGPVGDKLLANFYKCGDLTAQPHYLSWAPIDAPKPDFHRPECFGELTLE